MPIPEGAVQVPHLDGAGIVDAVGPGVSHLEPGDRVWLWLVAFKRLEGTAQEFATTPAELVSRLPRTASLELGDRKSVVEGKSGAVRVNLGGRGNNKKKKK